MANPRQGELLAAAVLRPLAEQLVAALDLRPGAVVCELMCDGGVLTRALAGVAGAVGTLIVTDTDGELARAAATEHGASCTVQAHVIDGEHVPLDDASCDAVVSLLSLGFAEAGALLREARRLLRPPGGIATLLVWDPQHPPAHEAALAAALTAHRVESPFLRRALAPVDAGPDAQVTQLRDVARLDTFAHLWAASVSQRAVAGELAAVAPATLDAIRRDYERGVAEFCAADGTMRIPLTARMLTYRRRDAPRR